MITRSPHPQGKWRLHKSIWLPAPREEVFEFFSDAFQLETITPPFLNFRVTTPAPIAMKPGTLIDYRLSLRGIPFKWRTLISIWEPPYRFVDEQLRGPYTLWHHEHIFSEQDGGTRVEDIVDYNVPGGAIIHWLIVKRDVEKIFAYREQTLRRIFTESAAESQVATKS